MTVFGQVTAAKFASESEDNKLCLGWFIAFTVGTKGVTIVACSCLGHPWRMVQ